MPDPLPEADIIQEQQTETNVEDAPQPTSEAHDLAQGIDIEEQERAELSTELQHVEGGHPDTLAVAELNNAHPPPIEADDIGRQLVPATPSTGLLPTVEMCQFPTSHILFRPCCYLN